MLTPDQEKLKEAALALNGQKWMPPETRYPDQGGSYNQINDEAGEEVIGYCGISDEVANFVSLANPAAILAILAQLDQVQGFLLEWWDGKCPVWMTLQEHAAAPEVNCATDKEQAMGRLAAAIATGQPLPPPPEAA